MATAGQALQTLPDRPEAVDRRAARGRWAILTLLVAVTIFNFIDRQTLSVLAPHIRELLHLSHQAYGRIVAAFQFGMMTGEFPMGWLMDRWGMRLGLGAAVLWWSIATGLHGVARSGISLGFLRFWMGTGECGNFSGGVKTVHEWFPKAERALAIGIFNGGAMIGAVVAPPLVVYLAQHYGYMYAFLVPAVGGICWVPIWWFAHGRIENANGIRRISDRVQRARESSIALLRHRQTWSVMAYRFLVGPVLQFYWYWTPDYLYSVRKMSLHQIGVLSWIPFLMGDIGSVAGGWVAAVLLRRHLAVRRTRQITMYLGAALSVWEALLSISSRASPGRWRSSASFYSVTRFCRPTCLPR